MHGYASFNIWIPCITRSETGIFLLIRGVSITGSKSAYVIFSWVFFSDPSKFCPHSFLSDGAISHDMYRFPPVFFCFVFAAWLLFGIYLSSRVSRETVLAQANQIPQGVLQLLQ